MADITITITLDETQQKMLLNDITDINQWFQDAATGKINNCWKRMQSEWVTKLMNDSSFSDSIPSNEAEFVTLVTSRSDYETRSERDASDGS